MSSLANSLAPALRQAPGGISWIVLLTTLLISGPSLADGGVTFDDIADESTVGIDYRRSPSASKVIFDEVKQSLSRIYRLGDFLTTPMKARGAPGVAIFDHDKDGDLDIYVTNGPGTANSLYSNQLVETGQLTFVDVGLASGAGAVEHDSSGVCFGDLDNDGDHDLLLVGNGESGRLLENQGQGVFLDKTAASGIGEVERSSTGCSMGDFNGDGLLDFVIANHYSNWNQQRPMFAVPFQLNEHNQLFINTGGNTFVDASASSGLESLAGLPASAGSSGTISWAIAAADYDLDGDLDIFFADEQGVGFSFDRGLIHLLQNDGSGQFTDVTVEAGTNLRGGWMGLTFGDFDCNGRMDLFATNIGDYTVFGEISGWASRWLLGQESGAFTDPGVGDLVTTPFGWGTSTFDYDNDGDTDIVYHGGMDVNFFLDLGNPGVILTNQDCSAQFVRDHVALAGSTDHTRRAVQGSAVGDLDRDGFVDIVSVSSFDVQPWVPLESFPPLGSPFDEDAYYFYTFRPIDSSFQNFRWAGLQFPDGSLSVEINSGGNGNAWVEVETMGSKGITDAGVVNRDGIGAVVFLTPDTGGDTAGRTVMRPIVGGSSYASQDSLAANFGLGQASEGTVEVLWPGGVRNRLTGVTASERLLFPEIPCSYTASWESSEAYLACVDNALAELVAAAVLSEAQAARFRASAAAAFIS